MNVFGHITGLILLDQQRKLTRLVWGRYGGIRSNDGLALVIKQLLRIGSFHNKAGGDGNERCFVIRKFEYESRQ
jgi:hypothetical protein